MKTVLAVIGGLVVAFAIMGALGLGHFRLCFVPTSEQCK